MRPYGYGDPADRALAHILAFDDPDDRFAANIGMFAEALEPVVLHAATVAQALELAERGERSHASSAAWALALIRRRDVRFTPGRSVLLLEALEHVAFDAPGLSRWRSALTLEPAPAVVRSDESRLAALARIVDLEPGFEATIAALRAEGQEASGPNLTLHPHDVARAVEACLDGGLSRPQLERWARFVLGRRDLVFESLKPEWMTTDVLIECSCIQRNPDARDRLEGSVSILDSIA